MNEKPEKLIDKKVKFVNNIFGKKQKIQIMKIILSCFI